MNKKDIKIGFFYGSDTGTTEGVATELNTLISSNFEVEFVDMYHAKQEDMEKFDYFVFGLSTWYDGQLQSDWDCFFETFCEMDFTGRIAAIFGCGDQIGYEEYFVDGIGILAKQFEKAGGLIVGKWPVLGYEFEISKARIDKNTFYGLPIDEDNQPELTSKRLEEWSTQISEEFLVEFKKTITRF